MKKNWKQPTLEVLDVKMTMWNLWGTHHDGAWTAGPNGTPVSNTVTNPTTGLLAEAQMS